MITIDWNIRFQFGELIKWGNTVLVARLQPADEASESLLNQIAKMRSYQLGPNGFIHGLYYNGRQRRLWRPL